MLARLRAWQFDSLLCHLGVLHAHTCVRSTVEQICANMSPQHPWMTLLNAVLAQETEVVSRNLVVVMAPW